MVVRFGRFFSVKFNPSPRDGSRGGWRAHARRGHVAMSGSNDEGEKEGKSNGDGEVYWCPHTRTGIYYPKGQEAVMEGVPDNAARMARNCWFRSTLEGEENHVHDHKDSFHHRALLDN